MDPFLGASLTREFSQSTFHIIIPANEAGIKQYRTCVDCHVWDATTRKRKRHKAKATAAQQSTAPASAEAPAGISTGNGPNGQK